MNRHRHANLAPFAGRAGPSMNGFAIPADDRRGARVVHGGGGFWEGVPLDPYEVSAGGVAVVRVRGVLVRDIDWDDPAPQAWAPVVADAVWRAAEDPGVRAVLLDIDSPGGEAVLRSDLAEAVGAVRSAGKPIVALAHYTCASLAYWMAALCDAVVATPSALVGSIGTVWRRVDASQALARSGVTVHAFARGPAKLDGDPDQPMSEDERARYEAFVAESHAEFVAVVRGARPGVDDAAFTGEMFDAQRALGLGLIDAVIPAALAVALVESAVAGRVGDNSMDGA